MKIVVKRRIRVNGKDYDRVEDLPPDVRKACERALAGSAGAPAGKTFEDGVDASAACRDGALQGTNARLRARISLGGAEYASVDEMPPDVKKLYEGGTALGVGAGAGGG